MTGDDDMMAALRRIAGEVDGVPELVDESARAAFSTRHLDDELAALLRDSELAGATSVRGGPSGPRQLSYEAVDVSIELQLEDVRGAMTLRGLVIGTVGDLEVETAGAQPRTVTVDEHGWFRVDGLTVAPVRVRARAATGTTVTTGWIRP